MSNFLRIKDIILNSLKITIKSKFLYAGILGSLVGAIFMFTSLDSYTLQNAFTDFLEIGFIWIVVIFICKLVSNFYIKR